MRVKPLPPPPTDIETVRDAQRSIPLVPKPEVDCCRRLMDRLGLDARDDARTWLTFLRGLGLVERGERGFTRSRAEPDRADLRDRFLAGVFGAEEIHNRLEDDPTPVDVIADAVEPEVPAWERAKQPGGWRAQWRERTGNVLGWLVLVGAARAEDDGYVRTD